MFVLLGKGRTKEVVNAQDAAKFRKQGRVKGQS